MATKKALSRPELIQVGAEFITLLGYTSADADKPFRVLKSQPDSDVCENLKAAIQKFIAGETKPKKSKKSPEDLLQKAPANLLQFIADNDLLAEDEEDEEEDGDEEEEEEEEEEDGAEGDDEDEEDEDSEEDDDTDEDDEDGDEDDEEGEDADDEDSEEDDDDLAAVERDLARVGTSRSVAAADPAPRKKAQDVKVERLSAEQPSGGAVVVSANIEAAVVAMLRALSTPNTALVVSLHDTRTLNMSGASAALETSNANADADEPLAPAEPASKKGKVGKKEKAAPAEKPARKAKDTETEKAADVPKLTRAQRKEVDAAVNTAVSKIDAQLMDRTKLKTAEARIAYIEAKGYDLAKHCTGPNRGKKLVELGTKKLGNIIRDETAARAERVAIKKVLGK